MPSLETGRSIFNILPVLRRHIDGKFKRNGLVLLTPRGRCVAASEMVEEAGTGWINNLSLCQFPHLHYTA